PTAGSASSGPKPASGRPPAGPGDGAAAGCWSEGPICPPSAGPSVFPPQSFFCGRRCSESTLVHSPSLRGARSATKQSPPQMHAQAKRDCFAEFTLGLAEGETRGLAMTASFRLAKLRAQRMGRINAEDRQLLGEEGELLERELEVRIVGMSLDVGVELGREEIALDHVAFKLGHVDPVGGKAAERLVERGRDVAHLEHE